MSSAPESRTIAVLFYWDWDDDQGYKGLLDRANTKCLAHASELDDMSRIARLFKRGSPYKSEVKEARRFVMDNYQPGDHVILIGCLGNENVGESKYNAIVQLAAALSTAAPLNASGGAMNNTRIPIKCICLDIGGVDWLQWSGFDRVLSDTPSIVENVFCLRYHDAYAVQRGKNKHIIRKEVWVGDDSLWSARLDWFVLQTGHIIEYNPSDLMKPNNPLGVVCRIPQPQVLSTMRHSNCTKRRKGMPCSDALPTGGQLTRVSKLKWATGATTLVWSHLTFVEGEYDDACDTLPVGPRNL